MRANEFVRKYGLDEATAFLSLDSDVEIIYTASFFDDLKRLVESHELVGSKGGLDVARNIVKSQHNLYTDMRLVQAIADVESCL